MHLHPNANQWSWCGWDELNPVHPTPRAVTTMLEFDSLRRTCRTSESFLEQTVEGAAHRLVRWNVFQLIQPWCSKEELLRSAFDRNYALFANSWELPSGLLDSKLREQPLENLSTTELVELWYVLEAFGTLLMDVTAHGYSVDAPNEIWISPLHRTQQW